MGMTHYMELMMSSWYLLVLFMAVPMLLAECYVVSEILLLLKPRESGALKTFNKASACASAVVIALLSTVAGFHFSEVTEWRTWVDVTASVAYVAAGLPFLYVGLLEAGVVGRAKDPVQKGHAAVAAVVAYLILSHAAMVFGMFDPVQFGYEPKDGGHHMMHDMGGMPAGHSMHSMHDMPMPSSSEHHCEDSMSVMKLPEGHPVPEGWHRMPDGTLMKNGPMMNQSQPAPSAQPDEALPAAGHHCG